MMAGEPTCAQIAERGALDVRPLAVQHGPNQSDQFLRAGCLLRWLVGHGLLGAAGRRGKKAPGDISIVIAI
jgi:hypothetical protein